MADAITGVAPSGLVSGVRPGRRFVQQIATAVSQLTENFEAV